MAQPPHGDVPQQRQPQHDPGAGVHISTAIGAAKGRRDHAATDGTDRRGAQRRGVLQSLRAGRDERRRGLLGGLARQLLRPSTADRRLPLPQVSDLREKPVPRRQHAAFTGDRLRLRWVPDPRAVRVGRRAGDGPQQRRGARRLQRPRRCRAWLPLSRHAGPPTTAASAGWQPGQSRTTPRGRADWSP